MSSELESTALTDRFYNTAPLVIRLKCSPVGKKSLVGEISRFLCGHLEWAIGYRDLNFRRNVQEEADAYYTRHGKHHSGLFWRLSEGREDGV